MLLGGSLSSSDRYLRHKVKCPIYIYYAQEIIINYIVNLPCIFFFHFLMQVVIKLNILLLKAMYRTMLLRTRLFIASTRWSGSYVPMYIFFQPTSNSPRYVNYVEIKLAFQVWLHNENQHLIMINLTKRSHNSNLKIYISFRGRNDVFFTHFKAK